MITVSTLSTTVYFAKGDAERHKEAAMASAQASVLLELPEQLQSDVVACVSNEAIIVCSSEPINRFSTI